VSGLAIDIRAERGSAFTLRAACKIPLDGITGIYGPSGSGKTSLLHVIAGLLPATGEVRLDGVAWQSGGECRPAHRRSVGYVYQDSRLFPHLDVSGNLDYAWRRRRREGGPTPARAAEWLGLENLLKQRPATLSRGQQQRVAIARALVNAPDLLLLDEPLANIDLRGRQDILSRLGQVQRESGPNMLYVSHDMAELSQLADWLLVLSRGEIAAQGPLLELSSDIALSLAHEDRAAAILEAEVAGQDRHYGLTELRLSGQPLYCAAVDRVDGTSMRLRVPARDVSLCRSRPEDSSILNILEVSIDSIEEGRRSQVLVRLKTGEQYLLARVTRKSLDKLALKPGEKVYAQVKSVALLSDTRVTGNE
jgi:molybdate transport system ATP-binding protein